MAFENISPELREKVCACQTSEELLGLANEAGVELPDEQLDAIAGGNSSDCDVEPCATAWHA